MAVTLLAVGSVITSVSPAEAAPWRSDPFVYRLYVTPIDGRTEPVIVRRYTPTLKACLKAAKVTSDNAVCYSEEFERQDLNLNQTWKATLARIAPARRSDLVKAQRKWVAARDPFCLEDSGGSEGGTIAPVVYSLCRAELTVRRTMWLEGLP